MFDDEDFSKLTFLPNGLAQGGFFLVGGPAGNHAVIPIKTTDMLLSVQALEFAQGVPHDVHYLGDEFTISADGVLNNTGGTDTTNMFLFVQIALAPRD
jgi:hypothetical protein